MGIVICTAGKTADRGTVFAVSNDKPSEFFGDTTATSSTTTSTNIATLSNAFAVTNDKKSKLIGSTMTTTITNNIATATTKTNSTECTSAINSSTTNNWSSTRNNQLNGDKVYSFSSNNVPIAEKSKDEKGKIFTSYKNGAILPPADNLQNSTG